MRVGLEGIGGVEMALLEGLLGIGSAGIGAIGAGLIGGLSSKRTMQNQKELLNMQQNFITKENQIMREREDNAIQRQSRDMAAAGINPLLAGTAGGANAQLGGMPSLAQAPDESASLNAVADSLNTGVANASSILEKPSNIKATEETINKIKQEIENLQDDLKTSEKERDQIERNIQNMATEEARLWEEIFNIAEDTELIKEKAISEQIYQSLMKSQTGLTSQQMLNLVQNLRDTQWYNENLRVYDQLDRKYQSNISRAEYDNAMATYYKILAETSNLEKSAAATKLRSELEKQKYDNRFIDSILDILGIRANY